MRVTASFSLVCDGQPPDVRLAYIPRHDGTDAWSLAIDSQPGSTVRVYGASAETIAADLEALAAAVRHRAREIADAQLLGAAAFDDPAVT